MFLKIFTKNVRCNLFFFKVLRRKFHGTVRNYNDVEGDREDMAEDWEDVDGEEGLNMEAEAAEEHEHDHEHEHEHETREIEDGEKVGSHPCFLCQEVIDHASEKHKIWPGHLKQLKQIYEFPKKLYQTLSSEILLMCLRCRMALNGVVSGRKQLSALPRLKVSLQPSRQPIAEPKYKRNKELLNMKTLTGKNRKYKTERPELAELLEHVKEMSQEYDYDCVEVGFFMLHNLLSSAGKIKMARHLKTLHANRNYCTMSPRKSVANKLYAGRSHRT